MERIEKCQGLIGKVLGHNFIELINEDYFGLSDEAIKLITSPSDQASALMVGLGGNINELIKDMNKYTKTPVAIICTRCGLIKFLKA